MPRSVRRPSLSARRVSLRFRLTRLEDRLAPATFTVNSLSDSNFGAGLTGTLRYALTQAAAGDVVQFDPVLFATPQTINSTSEFVIDDSITISGPGFDASGASLVTIANVGLGSRVFNVSGADVAINGVRITGGNVGTFTAGGGILFSGQSLTLENTVITGNTANTGGGIAVNSVSGQLTLINTTVSANAAVGAFYAVGGGVYFGPSGKLTVISSTLSGNSAQQRGGAVYFFQDGQFTVRNSTLSGNSAGLRGGAVYFFGDTDGPITVENSTVTGNAAGFGGGLAFASLGLVGGPLTVSSSIVAGNSGFGPDLWFDSAATVPGNNNLIGVADQGNFTLGGTNLTGTLATPLDPLLGPLAKNGGPTRTHALLPGSPATDAGNNAAGLATDQRGPGFPRVQGGQTDIGAFEALSPIPSASFAGLPTIVTAGATPNTLQVTFTDTNAINVATIGPGNIEIVGPGNIKLPVTAVSVSPNTNGSPRVATYTFTPPGGSWSFDDYGQYTVNLLANQVADTDTPTANFVPAGPLGTFHVAIPRVIVVDNPGDIDDGNLNPGELTLREAVNLANKLAGTADTITFDPSITLITLAGEQLTIADAVSVVGPGAGLLTIDAAQLSRHFLLDVAATTKTPILIQGVTLSGGSVSGDNGGSVLNTDEALTLSGVTLSNNTASGGNGGALATGSVVASVVINDSALTGNFSSGFLGGGAIFLDSISSLTLNRSTLTGNVSALSGGGIYATAGASVVVTASTLAGNSAAARGGAALLLGGDHTITNSTISGNSAGSGAALHGSSYVGISIANSTIIENVAVSPSGIGGIALSGAGNTLTLNSTIVARNRGARAGDLGVPAGFTVGGSNNLIGAIDPTLTLLSGTNLTGTPAQPLDPGLAPLANNGGPTLTHALQAGSPALNAGNNAAGLTTDQRGPGFARVVGPAADIGAVEGVTHLPVANPTLPADVLLPGSTPATITVRYVDDIGMNAGTFGIDDIVITGPGNTNVPVTGFSVDTPGNGSPRTVTYTFAIPGGSWDTADNGLYVVTQPLGAVADVSGNVIPAGALGSFRVAIGATFVVDNTGDVDDGNIGPGQLTLREAVRLSNDGTPGVADTITFSPAVFGSATTITMAGPLNVTDPVVIVGPGAKLLTLDAGSASRVMTIDLVTAGGAVALTGLTLTNGKVVDDFGGAILNENAALTVTSSAITANTAAAVSGSAAGGGIALVSDFASLTLVDSTLSDNRATGSQARGGGVHAAANSIVRVVRSTVSGNQSGEDGGGIYFLYGGELNVVDSTISGNQSNLAASGAGGGGVYLFATSAVVRNSTISGNQTNAGLFASGGGGMIVGGGSALVMQNSTLAFNSAGGAFGGGLAVTGGSVSIASTIVASNSAALGPDVSGPLLARNSLLGNSGGASLLTGSSANLLDVNPLLEPLAANGGPTLTHALKAGSPALNAGSNPAGLAFDQRGPGFDRLSGSGVDIGAFEALAATPAKVTGVVINNGAAQRSRVTSLKVSFDQPVTFADITKAFTLNRVSDSASVTLNTVLDGSGTFVTITFTGGAVDGANPVRSLADGRYTLVAVAGQFTGGGLDGDGNGIGGDNFVFASTPFVNVNTPATGIFRLFGDANGNGQVGTDDFLTFRLNFLSNNDAFDNDGNGAVDASDFLRFRINFLATIV